MCFTRTKEASDPLTEAALQAMQTASSSSCCGCGSIWYFPSIQYGLHAILPGQRHCGQRVSRLLGRFYGRKLRGPLLQRCDRAVLPCGVTCDRATVAETTCDRSGVNAQHAHTQKESERMGGGGGGGLSQFVSR